MTARHAHPLMQGRAVGLSPAAAALLEAAAAALDRQDPEAADAALARVLALEPDSAEALRMRGLLHHLRGDYPRALASLQQAHDLRPGDALIRMNLATSLYASGDAEAAVACLRRACAMVPDFAPTWFNLGKMYMLQGRPAGAITALQRTLDLDPEHVPARIVLAQAEASLGMVALARVNYREVLRRQPGQPQAWFGLASLDGERFSADDVAQLQQTLGLQQATVAARVALGFALVRALEDQAEPPAALRALHKANALQQRQLNWNATLASAQVDALVRAFPEPMQGAADATLGDGVIFIVALPQSGSLLTEQILAAHPQAVAADEVIDLQQILDAESARRRQSFPQWASSATAADWSRLGQDYLARIERWRGHQPCFIDRSLLNWRLVGAALAMLPGARVVNSRREAFESCFACYRQLFISGNDFSYDLDHMVSYWRDYDRLSHHWQQLFPVRFLEHDYESWLADPAARVRRLLEFCGLPFDPACVQLARTADGAYAPGNMPAEQLLRRDSARSAWYGGSLQRLRALLASVTSP
ncbi:sulfotransferase family protein [Rhodanobacter glycinis]|uniref:Sulfotransferase family protein n=1 Tax=Rhodanobacter glycinis TaxID=582702 RepID=A0A502C113_9GAMM|nr:tetratricopeptide repeat-containing sulfotransferase family protein [Rhodanobacter glycinis]TPG06463.1 sulfotransferase family protein [Rhodanobacter glycinis]